MHNRYPVLYHGAAYTYAQDRAPRPLARFNRSGWTGAARVSQIVWGGDPTTGFGFDGLTSAHGDRAPLRVGRPQRGHVDPADHVPADRTGRARGHTADGEGERARRFVDRVVLDVPRARVDGGGQRAGGHGGGRRSAGHRRERQRGRDAQTPHATATRATSPASR